MKREIKFRAWDLDNEGMWFTDGDCDDGEWGKDWYVTDEGSLAFKEYTMLDLCEGGEHVQREEWHTPNQLLMQYTGLKDKNGVEVYEGDVLKCGLIIDKNFLTQVIGEVQYVPSSACFCVKVRDSEGGSVSWNFMAIKHEEVIGNIYENPELLEAA